MYIIVMGTCELVGLVVQQKWKVYTTTEDTSSRAAGPCHSHWTNEEEGGDVIRAGMINAACSFLLIVKIKKYYKVTALNIMSI